MLFANDVLAEQESLVQDLCRHSLRVYSKDFQSVRDQESWEASFQCSLVRNIFVQPCSRNSRCMCSREILLENVNGVVCEKTTFRDRSRSVQSRVNWFQFLL